MPQLDPTHPNDVKCFYCLSHTISLTFQHVLTCSCQCFLHSIFNMLALTEMILRAMYVLKIYQTYAVDCSGFFSSNRTRVSVEHVDSEAVEGLAAAWMMTARNSDSLQVPRQNTIMRKCNGIFRNGLLVKLDT